MDTVQAACCWGAPTPVATPSSRAMQSAKRCWELTREAERRRRRASIDPDDKVQVDGAFEVCRDVAPWVEHPPLLAFLHRAIMRKAEVHGAPTAAMTYRICGTPQVRLVLELGTVRQAEGGGGSEAAFNPALPHEFAVRLRARMRKFPAWQRQTALPVTRYDHHLACGVVVQTLLHLQFPYLEHQATARRACDTMVVPMSAGLSTSPTAVRLVQFDEGKFQPTQRMAIQAEAVEIRQIAAFSANGWVYRIEECWRGPTLQAAELARQNAAPDVRVTVELLLREYQPAVQMRDLALPPDAGQCKYLAASALGKMRDLANNSPYTVERTRFALPPT